MKVCYQPIGVIHTPFPSPQGTPIQPAAARGMRGRVEIETCYAPALKDPEGFSHLLLLYHFHLSSGYALQVRPFLDETPRGLFATRAPRRPNSIGLSLVRLARIEGTTLHVLDVDIVDGTSLLDLKPYVPVFHNEDEVRIGWLTGKEGAAQRKRADGRFLEANIAPDEA
ncbi:MAG: tRNA (N6-threonylcarbamoyladenosine(37)-N6)-methyltransferase TrmO [Anaerolineae bacterium]